MTLTRKIFGLCDSASFFVRENRPPHLAHKLVELSGKARPVICYIGAAKGDNPDRIAEFQQLMHRVGADPQILSLYNPPSSHAEAYFEGADAIFVDGGSTRNLLALFREWDVVGSFDEAYRAGTLLAGASAGLNLLFEWCITDSVKTELEPLPGLGMIDGSVCVHHDSQPERQPIFRSFLQGGDGSFPAYALEDGVSLYFEDEQLVNCFTMRPDAEALQFTLSQGVLQGQSLSLARLDMA